MADNVRQTIDDAFEQSNGIDATQWDRCASGRGRARFAQIAARRASPRRGGQFLAGETRGKRQ